MDDQNALPRQRARLFFAGSTVARAGLLSVLALAGGGFGADGLAQTAYPSRTVSIVVPSSAGSPSDMIARLLAKEITAQTNAGVVTEDKPGANGIIGVQYVRNAPADGYTLLFTTMSPMVLNKYLFKSLPYDPDADFVPVGIMFRSTMFVAVNPKQPFTTVGQLIESGKREPDKLNFGYGTAVPQLAGSMFMQLTGARYTFVPYKSHNAMVSALMSGEVDMTITDTATLAPYLKAGQVRALATTNPARLAAYPDIPTLRELGIGYELVAWHGLFVRRGTSPRIVERLAELLKKAAKSTELNTYLANSSLDNFMMTGEGVQEYIQNDSERWEKITHDAGVVPN